MPSSIPVAQYEHGDPEGTVASPAPRVIGSEVGANHTLSAAERTESSVQSKGGVLPAIPKGGAAVSGTDDGDSGSMQAETFQNLGDAAGSTFGIDISVAEQVGSAASNDVEGQPQLPTLPKARGAVGGASSAAADHLLDALLQSGQQGTSLPPSYSILLRHDVGNDQSQTHTADASAIAAQSQAIAQVTKLSATELSSASLSKSQSPTAARISRKARKQSASALRLEELQGPIADDDSDSGYTDSSGGEAHELLPDNQRKSKKKALVSLFRSKAHQIAAGIKDLRKKSITDAALKEFFKKEGLASTHSLTRDTETWDSSSVSASSDSDGGPGMTASYGNLSRRSSSVALFHQGDNMSVMSVGEDNQSTARSGNGTTFSPTSKAGSANLLSPSSNASTAAGRRKKARKKAAPKTQGQVLREAVSHSLTKTTKQVRQAHQDAVDQASSGAATNRSSGSAATAGTRVRDRRATMLVHNPSSSGLSKQGSSHSLMSNRRGSEFVGGSLQKSSGPFSAVRTIHAAERRDSSAASYAALSTVVDGGASQSGAEGADSRTKKEIEEAKLRAAQAKKRKLFQKKLTSMIASAQHTHKLDLSENALLDVPEEIFTLPGLRQLWMQKNLLSTLPERITKMNHLVQLRLFENQISELPSNIGDMISLQVLWLQDNNLVFLPDSIGNLIDLRVLSVLNNPIRSLPITLVNCKILKELQVNNPGIAVPPLYVVEKGVNASFIYLKEYSRRLDWGRETGALDLSGMGMSSSSLPKEVTDLTSLTTLSLARNEILGVSEFIFNMASLTELDLSGCATLSIVASEVGLMSQLRVLSIDDCPIESPPLVVANQGCGPIVEYLKLLQLSKSSLELDISAMEIPDVDPQVCSLHMIESLDASSNVVTHLRQDFGQLTSLKHLSLHHNLLERLPDTLSNLVNLETLDISNNRLRQLGPYVGKWWKLISLNLLNNPDMPKLPMHFGNMSSLTNLQIDAQQFHRPPPEILKQGAAVTVKYCFKFRLGSETLALQLPRLQLLSLPIESTKLPNLCVLDVQHNFIRVLPSALANLQQLVELLLSQNPMSQIPDVVSELHRLSILRADSCQLTCIPDWLAFLPDLTVFSVTNNSIDSVPESLGRCQKLSKIHVDKNQIFSLPHTIGNCETLTEVTLTKNKVSMLPASFGNLTRLEDLRVSYNHLEELAPEISRCTSLTRLRFPHNNIKDMPMDFWTLTCLTELSIQNNSLSTIPIYVGTFHKLANLTYSGNPFISPSTMILDSGAPYLMRYMRHVAKSVETGKLDLSHTDLTVFPIEIGGLTQLRVLLLDGNHIEHIPHQASTLVSLTHLSVAHNRLEHIHHSLGSMRDLRVVSLRGNRLDSIPLGWGASAQLRTCDLSDNNPISGNWRHPPPEVVVGGDAPVIEYLQRWSEGKDQFDLRHEALQLQNFPPSDTWLTDVLSVSLSRNKLTSLPASIHSGTFHRICSIILSHNEISELPLGFSTLQSLTAVDLSNNAFGEFPNLLIALTSLQQLYVDNNHFKHIDPRMGRATGLQEIKLDGEIMVQPPPEVAMQGTAAINRYWHNLIDARGWHKASGSGDAGELGPTAVGGILDMHALRLIRFPPEAKTWENLGKIDLSRNRLSLFPPELSGFPALRELDLSRNVIPSVTAALGVMKHLLVLNLSRNKIVEIPPLLGSLSTLTKLDVSHNNLAESLDSAARLLGLEYLDLSYNQFSALPLGIGNCSKLKFLGWSHNLISVVPPELGQCQDILSVRMCANPRVFPTDDIVNQGLEHLLGFLAKCNDAVTSRALELQGMGMAAIPPFVTNTFTSVTSINLSGNSIQVVPPSISKIKELRVLDIEHNGLTTFPLEFGMLDSLVEIKTAGNPLQSPPAELVEQGARKCVEYFQRLLAVRRGQFLDISALGLQTLPVETCLLNKLTEIDFSRNQMSTIVAGIGNLKNLRVLNASQNKICKLPESLWSLVKLTHLNLGVNLLSLCPSGVSRLTALKELILSDNRISKIDPRHFVTQKGLERLDFNGNQIDSPPSEVQTLDCATVLRFLSNWAESMTTNDLDLSGFGIHALPLLHTHQTELTSLNLKENKIRNLPDELADMICLTSLDISSNLLVKMDPGLGGLTSLKILNYEDNPNMLFPPPSVFAQGAASVVRCLNEFRLVKTTGSLELDKFDMTEIPIEVLECNSVLALSITENEIKKLPARWLYSAECLSTLVLDYNMLTSLDNSLSQLSALVSLSAVGNHIQEVSAELRSCSLLKSIDLKDNNIVEIPWELGALPRIEYFNLAENKDIDLPPLEIVENQGSRGVIQYLVRLNQIRTNAFCDLSAMDISNPRLPENILAQTFLASLSLAQNQLQDLDDSLSLLGHCIKSLFLDDNSFKSVPNVIHKLTNLKTLSLSGNQIKEVPSWLCEMESLTNLSVASNNGMRRINPRVALLTNLARLDVAGCPMESPPNEIVTLGTNSMLSFLTKILNGQETLEVRHTGLALRDIDVQVLQIDALRVLDVSDNALTAIPSSLGSLTCLVRLDVSKNRLGSVPPSVANLPQLESLDISHNDFANFGEWFQSMSTPLLEQNATPVVPQADTTELNESQNQSFAPNEARGKTPVTKAAMVARPWPKLRTLMCSNNSLVSLHGAIGWLTSLHTLVMNMNPLKKLPVDLIWLTKLTSLEVYNCPVESPPQEVVTKGLDKILQYLGRFKVNPAAKQGVQLLLNSQGLLSVPLEVADFAHCLHTLDLSDNALTHISEAVSSLSGLTTLRLGNNQLQDMSGPLSALNSLKVLHAPFNRVEKLPADIVYCTSLTEISLVDNSLVSVGAEIGSLQNLESLKVSRNQIVHLDSNVGDLRLLKEFRAEHNSLSSLPHSLGHCTSLEVLRFEGNRLKELPDNFALLTRLVELDISSNHLQMIAPSIGALKGIQIFKYDGNTLESIPKELAGNKANVMLRYLGCLHHGLLTGELTLQGEGLQNIPPYVLTMTGLTSLHVNRNRLRNLPENFTVLKNLKDLDVSDNFMRSLPLTLYRLQLVKLDMGEDGHNEWVDPPPEVRDAGVQVVLHYLRNLHTAADSNSLLLKNYRLRGFPPSSLTYTAVTNLDISSNDLVELPYDVDQMLSLTNLDASQNTIRTVASGVANLTALHSLHLQSNSLEELPAALSRSTALTYLNLDSNRFMRLPIEAVNAPFLKELNLRNNDIATWDFAQESLGGRLKILRLGSNPLNILPDSVSRLSSLTELGLDNCSLTHVCEGLSLAHSLSTLHLHDNKELQMLPGDLGLLQSCLETLTLQSCPLTLLPSVITEKLPDASALLDYLLRIHISRQTCSLSLKEFGLVELPGHVTNECNLTELDISNNLIRRLPDSLGKLVMLTDLVLDYNPLIELPDGFADCLRVTRLSLLGLSMKSPPPNILARGVVVIREWVRRLRDVSATSIDADSARLDLSSLALEGWPKELETEAFTKLERLSLIDNLLTEVPASVELLSNLKTFVAGYNQITQVSHNIGTIVSMETLQLPFNQITELPESVGNLRNLSSINLDSNSISVFPACICNCRGIKEIRLNQNTIREINPAVGLLGSLEDLQMSYNNLQGLPPRLGFCTSLTKLKLSYNQLQEVPVEICNATNLKELTVTHNKLTTLPPALGVLPRLTDLHIASNFFKPPLNQISQRGAGATLRYLKELHGGNVPSLAPQPGD